jgi:hypothetical protein
VSYIIKNNNLSRNIKQLFNFDPKVFIGMRKNIKIKASIIALSWMLLFMHEAIPHNHSHNICQDSIAAELNHLCNSDCHSDIDLRHFSNSDRSEVECHFSVDLFPGVSYDYFVPSRTISGLTNSEALLVRLSDSFKSDIPGPPLIDSITLRGPPQA